MGPDLLIETSFGSCLRPATAAVLARPIIPALPTPAIRFLSREECPGQGNEPPIGNRRGGGGTLSAKGPPALLGQAEAKGG